MMMETQAVIRAAIAVQVAAIEWEESEISDTMAIQAVEKCQSELTKAVKSMKRKFA